MSERYKELCEAQGWKIIYKDKETLVQAHNREFRLTHPYLISLSVYRDSLDVEEKLQAMLEVHNILWPRYIPTLHEWTIRRFRAHCGPYKQIVEAGGANCGKSMDAAKKALIFWLSDPLNNACVVASTTLESLESRIWGYVMKLIGETEVPIALKILRSKPPKVMYPRQMDKIHGMFAVAIRMGDDDKVIGTLIGRHPNKRLMVILDEATEMNPLVTKAIPNLEKAPWFQLEAIGNSNNTSDLHGSLATPLVGWEKIKPERDWNWQTTHKHGICLYFYPYDSPAITDPDPVKRLLLSRFLFNRESIEADKSKYGEDSSAFWRFTLGFWPRNQFGNTIASQIFLTENQIQSSAEWSGFYPLNVVAGLDPAIRIGAGKCVMQLGVMGQTTAGRMVLEFRREELTFKIDIRPDIERSGELQIAQEVVSILKKFNCPVQNLAMDATGMGRALGELIRIVSGEGGGPFRLVSARFPGKDKEVDPHIKVVNPTEMWMIFRELVQNKQIRGLSSEVIKQVTNRLLYVGPNGKLILESKEDFKTRMAAVEPGTAHSPDESDALIQCVMAAVLRYGLTAGLTREIPKGVENSFWQEKMFVVEQERMDRIKFEATLKNSRPKLSADFAAPVEDIPPMKYHS